MASAGGLRAPLATRPERAVRGVSARWALAAGAFVLLATLLGLALGPVDLGLAAVVREVLSHVPFLGVESSFTPTQDAILWELRAPRVALGLLVGAMLASAGAAYQGVFRNPLADPYLLGAAAGAGLGATIVIAYDLGGEGGLDLRPIAAFVGATLGVGIAYLLGRSVGGRGTTTLILAGVTVAAFLTAVQTYVQQRSAETVQEVYSWILGQLETSGLDGRADPAAVRRRQLDRPAVAPPAARRPRRRRRRGRQPGRAGGARAADRGRRGHAGHGGRGRVQRPDRVRRDHRPARGPADGGDELPGRPAALTGVRRRLPGPHGPGRADGDRPGAAPDRRRHRVPRRARSSPSSCGRRGRWGRDAAGTERWRSPSTARGSSTASASPWRRGNGWA